MDPFCGNAAPFDRGWSCVDTNRGNVIGGLLNPPAAPFPLNAPFSPIPFPFRGGGGASFPFNWRLPNKPDKSGLVAGTVPLLKSSITWFRLSLIAANCCSWYFCAIKIYNKIKLNKKNGRKFQKNLLRRSLGLGFLKPKNSHKTEKCHIFEKFLQTPRWKNPRNLKSFF